MIIVLGLVVLFNLQNLLKDESKQTDGNFLLLYPFCHNEIQSN